MARQECWLMWYGGSSYAVPELKDVEYFESIRALKDAFWRRQDFDPYYPCVTDDEPDAGGQSGYVFFYDPNDETNGPGDPYPDRIICHGPRGGIKLEYT